MNYLHFGDKLQLFDNPAKSVKKSLNFLNLTFDWIIMAKRVASTEEKLISFDLESLLMSDLYPEDNDSQTFSSESCNYPKKFKTKNRKPLPANKVTTINKEQKPNEKDEDDETDEPNDVAKFFENVGNDFKKSMQLRKSKLGQFTEAVISVYQTKFTDMITKQGAEIDEFKERTISSFEEELNKCEEDFKKLKLQESKLMKIFEQQLKMIQKASAAQSEWTENFRKLHKNFVEAFEEIKVKHRNETLELKKSITTEVCQLQNKFLVDSKKEEMQTMKKYLSSVYF